MNPHLCPWILFSFATVFVYVSLVRVFLSASAIRFIVLKFTAGHDTAVVPDPGHGHHHRALPHVHTLVAVGPDTVRDLYLGLPAVYPGHAQSGDPGAGQGGLHGGTAVCPAEHLGDGGRQSLSSSPLEAGSGVDP